jgi:hypothetical protein
MSNFSILSSVVIFLLQHPNCEFQGIVWAFLVHTKVTCILPGKKIERFHALLPKTFLPFKSKVKNNGTLSTCRTEPNYSALLDWQKRDLPFSLEKLEKQRNWALTQVRLLHGDVLVTTQF